MHKLGMIWQLGDIKKGILSEKAIIADSISVFKGKHIAGIRTSIVHIAIYDITAMPLYVFPTFSCGSLIIIALLFLIYPLPNKGKVRL